MAMAFAIASGVKPEAGIFTAVIAGFLVSALGGTRVAIGGPTGAFIVILYGIYAKYGAENLAICTMMAGVILFIMGVARLGTIIKYIPYPVTMGFTSGIAVLIFSTQIKDFLGLTVEKVPSDFVRENEGAGGARWTRFNGRRWRWRRLAGDHSVLAQDLAAARAGLDRGADSGHGGGGAFSSAGGNHRHAGLAAFRRRCRIRIFPRCRGKISSICSSPPRPSPCWRPLNPCSARWWPTA